NAVNMPSLAEGLLEKVSPYMELGERLGSLLAQLVDGGIKRVSLSYQGRPVDPGPRPVTASALQGLRRHFMQETVNLVNASHLAKERGIEVVERVTSEAEVFSDLISMEVETDLVRRSAAGTFFRPGDPRVVSLDSYDVEAIPEGYMLIFSNRDTPGVIGSIGTILGDHGINIAGMQLGRRAPKEMAVAIVNVDSPIPHDVMEKIRHLPTILDAKLVHL
ncbi:MAG: ACT domain-containing protein, partial [Nitrospinota bacterium]